MNQKQEADYLNRYAAKFIQSHFRTTRES
jgi:hypothetical protein